MLTDEQFEAVHKAWYECGIDLMGGEWSKFAAKLSAAPAAQPEPEPVAYLWQHSETGRTRVVMPDQVTTADASWIVVGPLYLGIKEQPC